MKLCKYLLPIVLLFLLLTPAVLFADATGKSIKVGVILPLSGEGAVFGELVRRGIESALKPGIKLVFEDDVCDPARAVTAYRKLASFDQISLILGPVCASPQKAVAPLLKNSENLLMLPVSSSESVDAQAGGRIFSAQYSIEQESAFIAKQMDKEGLKRAIVICQEHEFCQWHSRAFEKAFSGTVVRSLRYPSFDNAVIRAAALQLRGLDFDVIYFPDALPLLQGLPKELERAGVKRRPMYAVYSAQLPEVIKVNAQSIEGLLYSYPDIPDETDAIEFFPKVAAELLFASALECNGVADCVYGSLLKSPDFKGSRVRTTSKIVLKTIRNGRFVRVEK